MKTSTRFLAMLAGVLGSVSGSVAQDELGIVSSTLNVKNQWPLDNLCVDSKGCLCQDDISKLPITSPEGMSLVGVCDYHNYRFREQEYMSGEFYFSGETMIRGKVSAERSGEAGNFYFFNTDDRKKFSLFSSSIHSLRLDHDFGGIKFPNLSDENVCWSADAVLKIKQLKVVWNDYDTAGSFPEEYAVVQVGQFNKCEL